MARQQLQQQPLPDNPMILNLFEQRVGQQMVQEQILLAEAAKLGIHATNDDVIKLPANGFRRARCCIPTGSSSARKTMPALFPSGSILPSPSLRKT